VTKLETVLIEYPSGASGGFLLSHWLEDWQHLPECDSFDWGPPSPPDPGEGWRLIDKAVDQPQAGDEIWFATRREWSLRENLNPFINGWHYRRRIEPPKPVESPDDWVTQDRVPPRSGVDQVRWAEMHDWAYAMGIWVSMPSDKYLQGTLQVRCRRKDLPRQNGPESCAICGVFPPIEGNIACKDCVQYAHESAGCPPDPTPKTRTVVLREWVVCVDGEHWYLHWGAVEPQGYQEIHPTGETRTIEVPE
jgi:hypothetical protein